MLCCLPLERELGSATLACLPHHRAKRKRVLKKIKIFETLPVTDMAFSEKLGADKDYSWDRSVPYLDSENQSHHASTVKSESPIKYDARKERLSLLQRQIRYIPVFGAHYRPFFQNPTSGEAHRPTYHIKAVPLSHSSRHSQLFQWAMKSLLMALALGAYTVSMYMYVHQLVILDYSTPSMAISIYPRLQTNM